MTNGRGRHWAGSIGGARSRPLVAVFLLTAYDAAGRITNQLKTLRGQVVGAKIALHSLPVQASL